MAVDPRRHFGDALLAVCNEDPERVEHPVAVVAVSADGRVAWCVDARAATCVELSSGRVLRRVSEVLPDRPVAVFAAGDEPAGVTVACANGAVLGLAGARLGGVGRSLGRAVFSRDGSLLATLPSPGDPAREASVWSLSPMRRRCAVPAEPPLDLAPDGSMLVHGVYGWKRRGLGFTRVSDGVTVRRSFGGTVHAVCLPRPEVAWATVGTQVVRVPMDPAAATEPVPALAPGRGHALLREGDAVVGADFVETGPRLRRGDGARLHFRTGDEARVALTPGARGAICVPCAGGAVVRGSFDDGAVLGPAFGHDRVCDLAWCTAGLRIATLATDGTVAVWDATTGACEARLEGLCPGPDLALAWHPDGQGVVVLEGDGAVSRWSVHDGDRLWRIPPPAHRPRPRNTPCRVMVSPDGEGVAIFDGGLRVYRAAEASPQMERAEAIDAAWHADHAARLVVVSRIATTLLRWETLDPQGVARGASGEVRSLGFSLSRDGRHLWSQPTFTARGAGISLVVIDSPVPQGVSFPVHARDPGPANGGTLLAGGVPESPVAWVLRVDRAPRALGWTPLPGWRQAISPEGNRVALVWGGRVAIVSL